LNVRVFQKDMADFAIRGPKFDGAYCTVDTFRHLLTEEQAVSHLQHIARHLKENAIYVLGLHLLPSSGFTKKVHRWQGNRGKLTVHSCITVLDVDRRKREEILHYTLRVRNKKYRSIYRLRTYTFTQFQNLLRKAGCFKIMSVHDLDYDLNKLKQINNDSEDIVCILKKI
jgi:hypothetical protein